MSSLDQLKQMTTVVVDSSDFHILEQYGAIDATTNPSLVYKACQQSQYHDLVQEAILWGKQLCPQGEDPFPWIFDAILTAFGQKILEIVPGRVSTEVDARLSFDQEASIQRAERLMEMYQKRGVDSKRVLIKLASTWEGVLAAEKLERQGIHCNMTLLFSLPQAIAAAQVGATLISPFVGRILDWAKDREGFTGPSSQDPGVLSVQEIYRYYKARDIQTTVMGASFRNTGEILELAGCDALTISPQLLQELQQMDTVVELKLLPQPQGLALETLDEPTFRYQLNANAMATEKLAEGIRGFVRDTELLETYLQHTFLR